VLSKTTVWQHFGVNQAASVPHSDYSLEHTGEAALRTRVREVPLLARARVEIVKGVEHSDFVAARHWYERAAAQGMAWAEYNLGYLHLLGQGVIADTAEGLRWMRRAANRGFTTAQYELGLFHAQGLHVRQDFSRAARWYRRAAERGLPDAQHNLAHLYLAGQGVACDPAAATTWFSKAAQQGFGPSQMALLKMQLEPG